VVPPALLADRPGLRLWHKLDATFRLPRASASFLLASAATYDSPAAAAATHVAVALLEDKLCETAYLAEVAGLSYEVRGRWLRPAGRPERRGSGSESAPRLSAARAAAGARPAFCWRARGRPASHGAAFAGLAAVAV